MKPIKSIRFLSLVAFAATTVISGLTVSPDAHAQSTLEQLREQGYVKIAVANEPPYTKVRPDGTVTGAAPEVARAVFKMLGVPEIRATVTTYGAMIPGLKAGRFAAVSAGLFMNPERCSAVLYSQPQVCGSEGALVAEGNPFNIHSYEDMANSDAVVGVCAGCVEQEYAEEAGVPESRMVIVPDVNSGIRMVQSGRIDVYAMPTLSLKSAVQRTGAEGVEVIAPLENTPIACGGTAFRLSDAKLRDAYDRALAKLKAPGRFKEIIEPFGFSAAAAKATTRKELCGGPNLPPEG